MLLLSCQRNMHGMDSKPDHAQQSTATNRTHEAPKPHESRTDHHATEHRSTANRSDEQSTTLKHDTTPPPSSRGDDTHASDAGSTSIPATPTAPDAQAETQSIPTEQPLDHQPEPTRLSPGPGFTEVSRGSKISRRIALTFDAGADPRPTPKILEALAKHNLHATFFLTGKWIQKNPELAARITAEGHEIGNHTYSHKRLTSLNAGEIANEAERTEQLVLKVTGHSTKPYLRCPYGERDKRVLSVLRGLGYRSIYWDVDSWDSVKVNITSAEIEQRVMKKVRNGSIVLMHCGSKPTSDALDSLIGQLLSAGYQPVTVSELLGG